ncbi:MAG TPA: hypothetical protein VHP83_07225, partial [Aggregatilineaceae bacterium]|nr:hypothetical protein [Aggregatilineaceae bacterium]
MEEWLPACTDEELAQESVAESDAYLTRYFEEIEPAFNEDFSDDGVISDENLLLMAQSVDELNQLDEELPACEPVFSKAFDIYRLYLESSLIALHMRLSSIDDGAYAEAIAPLSMARLGWATEELFGPYRPVEEAE